MVARALARMRMTGLSAALQQWRAFVRAAQGADHSAALDAEAAVLRARDVELVELRRQIARHKDEVEAAVREAVEQERRQHAEARAEAEAARAEAEARARQSHAEAIARMTEARAAAVEAKEAEVMLATRLMVQQEAEEREAEAAAVKEQALRAKAEE